MSAFRLLTQGDSMVVVEFEELIDPAVNARAVALAAAIHAAALPGVRDVVPTYRTVAVHVDPLRTDLDALTRRLEMEAARPEPGAVPERPPIRVPVCYGGECGPDLSQVAAFAGTSEAEVVTLHSSRVYRVFMLGFVPGFAYLGLVDARIAAPRRTTPRVRVPAGSVGIAGAQTAVYPSQTPGGWQLIGRTSLRPFDLSRPEPFLLKAGDTVQFFPIEPSELESQDAVA